MTVTRETAEAICDHLAAGFVDNVRAACFGERAGSGTEWENRIRALLDVYTEQVVRLAYDSRPPMPSRAIPDETWREVATLLYARVVRIDETLDGPQVRITEQDMLDAITVGPVEVLAFENPRQVIVRPVE